MTGQATSLGLASWAPREWRSFASFVRRPDLPDRASGQRLAAFGAVLLAAGLLAGAALLSLPGPRGALALVAVLVLGVAAAIALLWRKRGQPPMGWFARHFRWFYLLSALAFASIHLTNFTEGNAALLLPLTLPQLLLGLILGYARVSFGLWSSMLMHGLHNTLFIGLVLAGAG